MTDRQITTNTVQVKNGELEISAYLAIPEGEGPFPGIIVLQEIFGINIHIRDVTERIAKEGYVAIAPALFQRQAPGFETGYTPDDMKIGRGYAMQTTVSELLEDIQAAIDYLKTLPQVRKDAFGCIGFCFGGHVAYLAATLQDIKATASFYGARIATGTFGEGEPTVTKTSEIKSTIYLFFGMADASIPLQQIELIEAELKKHKISHHVFRYDKADHGFFCDRRGSYHPAAAVDAWEKVKQLFTQELQRI